MLQIKGSSVAIQGRYAYVGDALQLQVIDIANPAAPLAVGTYPVCPPVVTVFSTLPFSR